MSLIREDGMGVYVITNGGIYRPLPYSKTQFKAGDHTPARSINQTAQAHVGPPKSPDRERWYMTGEAPKQTESLWNYYTSYHWQWREAEKWKP